MKALERFSEYALDFEKTYDDDDWSRLEKYFAPDAVYEVRNVPFACRLEGVPAILRGIKKSIDGFDRKLTKRSLALTEPPKEEGDTVRIRWTATYAPAGAPPFVLRGRSTARYRGDRIAELVDEYSDDMSAEAADWMHAHGPGLDASYT